MKSPIERAFVSTIIIIIAAAASLGGCSSSADARAERGRRVPVFLVRHGESWKNVEHAPTKTEAELDTLTPKGKEQADAAARAILAAWGGPVEIQCSALGRAVETGERISDARGRHEFVGKSIAALAPIDRGETIEDKQRVAARSIEQLVELAPESTAIVIVTHADVIAALLGKAAGTPAEQCFAKHAVPTGSVSIVDVGADGSWKLVAQAR